MGTLITGGIYGDNTGETYVKCLWFESISSGTSGTLALPTQGTVVLDQWSAGVDALASQISSGIPTFVSPATAGGVTITATLDAAGAWTLSGTPSAYPVAIIYVYQVKLRYFNATYSLGSYELIPSAVGVSVDVTSFGGNLTSAENTVQKALDKIDDAAGFHTQGTDTALGAVGTKNPPIDADKALYRDSVASDALVTSTWTQIKAFLKTYFDTLYNLYVHPNHSGEVTSVADGAQTIANKQTMSATAPITLSNTPTVIAAAAPVIAIPAATASVNGYATSVQITKLDGIEAAADVTDAVNIASSIVGVADKATPVDADSIGLIDSAAANVLKETTWASIKTTLKAYFDGIYAAVLGADDNYVTDAEKAALHAAATVADTDSLDLSLTGQQISGVVNQSWVMARSLFR